MFETISQNQVCAEKTILSRRYFGSLRLENEKPNSRLNGQYHPNSFTSPD